MRSRHEFAEAIQVVEATVREYPDPRLSTLLQALEADLALQRRTEAVLSACAEAQEFLDRKQPENAVRSTLLALAQYPDEPQLIEILARAREDVRAMEQARAVAQIGRELDSLVAARDFARALQVLARGQADWPGDAELQRRQQTTLAAKAAWERTQAIEEKVRQGKALGAKLQFVEAVGLAEEALHQYPNEPSLLQLKQQLEADWQEHERREAIRKALEEAAALMAAGRLEDAIGFLQAKLQTYPGEGGLQSLLAQCQEEVRTRARIAAVAKRVNDARALAESQDFDQALQLLEQGLTQYPGEPVLQREIAAIGKAKAAWQRQLEIAEVVRQAIQWSGEKRFAEALQLLSRALPKYNNDSALRDARQQVDKDAQEHKRREAIAKAAADGAVMLERGQLDAALKLLADACAKYPGEAELDRLLARAQHELEARQRAQAIAKVVAEAQSLVAQKNYDGALQILGRALQTWPGEESLLLLQKTAKADKAAWEREQAIRNLVRAAEQLLRVSKFDEALQKVDQSLEQYPGAPALAELRQRIEREREQKLRAEAVAAVTARAKSLLKQGQLDEAVSALRDACQRYAGEASLEALLAQAQQEVQARQKKADAVQAAERLLAEDQLDDAILLLQQALMAFPGDAVLTAPLARARTRLAARQRAEAVARVVDDCRALAGARNFDAALTQLDRSLKIWPDEKSLVDLRQSVAAAKAAWQREQTLQERIKLLDRLDRESRFAQGLELSESALREFPGDAALLQFRTQFRNRKALQEATTLLQQGLPADALSLLEELVSAGVAEPSLPTLIERAREDIRAQEQAAAIQQLSAGAQARVAAGDFDGALALLDRGLGQWPRESSLLDLRQATLQAQQDASRQKAILDALRQCETLEKENRFAEALQLASQTVAEFVGEKPAAGTNAAALQQAVERLQAKVAEEKRLRERARDIAELAKLDQAARQAPAAAKAQEFLEQARRIVQRYPGDAQVAAAGAGLLEQSDNIAQAQQKLAGKDFAGAVDICAKALQKFPGHVTFGQLHAEAEAGHKVAFFQELRRRTGAGTNLEVRIRLLEDAVQRYPSETWAADELLSARKQFDLARSVADKALAHEKAEQWDEALAQWNNLATLYKAYPGLDEAAAGLSGPKNRRLWPDAVGHDEV